MYERFEKNGTAAGVRRVQGRNRAHVTRNRRMDRTMLRAGTSPAPVTAIQRQSRM